MADRNRDLTLWQFLVWTYRDQMAHRYLKTPNDWFIWAVAIEGLVDDLPRATVDPDAAQLHAAVCNLTADQARLIVHFALEQQQPQPPTAMPTPQPVRIDRGLGLGRGERIERIGSRGVEHLVRWLDQAAIVEPIYKKWGRRLRRIGQRIIQHPVEFCPIDWQPSMAFVIMLADTHRRWVEAMRALHEAILGETWKAIAINGSGVENEHFVDVTDMVAGLSRALEEGWTREVDLERGDTEVTHFRGVDEEGETQVDFLTRKVRAVTKRRRDSASRRPGGPVHSSAS